ncbi:MAG TPA: hydrogenase subunit MbhD domain-containing protein [Gaiellaceae bacterium]|nr:hydrogenase subunit MbhD domain-containing protein [Gaiellaceae bacterium]
MTVLATLVPLQYGLFGLVALGAPAVVLSRDPLRMTVVNGLYGLVLVLLFVLLGAPDVALSMLVVTTVAYPVVLLVAIARSRSSKEEMDEA